MSLRSKALKPSSWCDSYRVDGGRFFVGNVMKVVKFNRHIYQVSFDEAEIVFLENKSKDSRLTESEILEMCLAQLFLGGHSHISKKESANELER